MDAGNYTLTSASGSVTITAHPMAAWQYKMEIAFSGYGQSETLTDFPVLVKLTDGMYSSAFDHAQFASTDGYDLRFTASDGSTILPYEIESWNPSGTSYVWVKVPALAPNTTTIWAYWGNPAEADTPEIYTTDGSTWDSHFTGVWHLNESGATSNAVDSSGSGNHGVQAASPGVTSGQVGGARNFTGSHKFTAASVDLSNKAFSIEAWAKPTLTSGDNMWGGGYEAPNTRVALHAGFRNNVLFFGLYSADIEGSVNRSGDVGSWNHYVMWCDAAGNKKIFRNGIQEPSSANVNTYLGVGYTLGGTIGGDASFQGQLDEMRASVNIARSTNWIWATYNNIAVHDTFQIYGEVIVGETPVADRYVAKHGSDANGGTRAAPWLTIQHALNNSADDDVIAIGVGTYTEGVIFTAMGVKRVTLKGGFDTVSDWAWTPETTPTIMAAPNTSTDVVTMNTHSNSLVGLTLTGGNRGLYISLPATSSHNGIIRLERCVITGNAGHGVYHVWGDLLGNYRWNGVQAVNTLIVNNGGDGLRLMQNWEATYSNQVVHCTIANNTGNGITDAMQYGVATTIRNSIIANNAGYGYARMGVADVLYSRLSVVEATGFHNNGDGAIWSVNDDEPRIIVLNGVIQTDPRFVGSGDYRLQSGSPAVGVGLTLAEVTADLDGGSRAAPYDLGAYESAHTPATRHAQTYVDASRPDNSGDGTTPATAKKTIGAALALTAAEGVCTVAAGTYAEEVFLATRDVTLEGAGAALTAVSAGSGQSVLTMTASNVTARGLAFMGGSRGVHLSGNIYSTTITPAFTLEQCVIKENFNGVFLGSDGDALRRTYLLDQCQVISNTHHGVHHIFAIGYGTFSGLRLVNTLVAENGGDGLHINIVHTYLTGKHEILHCTIANNAGSGISQTGDWLAYLNITNTIISGNGAYGVRRVGLGSASAPHTLGYSLLHGNVSGNTNGDVSTTAGMVYTSPAFDAGTYRLTSGSPAINAAANMGITEDIEGSVRPLQGGYDIGAYELKPSPSFSGLNATPSATYGDTSVILGGTLSAPGPYYPSLGETVSVTINGNTQTGTVNDGVGGFSVNYNPSALNVSGSPYAITYSYGGSASLNAAEHTGTSLTINKANLAVTAVADAIFYGDAAPSVTVAYSGFVGGDHAGDLDNTGFILGTGYTLGDDAGTYNTTITLGTALDDNYAFTPLNTSVFEVEPIPSPQSAAITAVGTRHLTVGWTLIGYQTLIVRREGANPDAPQNGVAYAANDTYGPDNRNTVVAALTGDDYTDNGVYPQTGYCYGLFGVNNDYYSPGAFVCGTTLTGAIDGSNNEWVGTVGTVVNASTHSQKEFIWRDKTGEQRNDSNPANPANADIHEFRVRADANDVYFYIKLQDITDVAFPYIAIGVDTDRNPADTAMNWIGDDSGTGLGDGYFGTAGSRYTERNIIVHTVEGHGQRIELFADNGTEWYGDLDHGNAAVNFNGTDNFIEFRISRSDLGLTGDITGRFTVASFFNNTLAGPNNWANDVDTTANYSTTDALDSLTVLPYGVNDGAGNLSAWDEDLSDGDIDAYFDIKFDDDGLVANVTPSAPAWVFPANNAVFEEGPFAIMWGSAADADDLITSYFYEFSAEPTFGGGENMGIDVRLNTTANQRYQLFWSPPTPDTDYYWNVRARDLAGALGPREDLTFRQSGPDDDTAGPVARLLYVGPNYTIGAVSLNITDADMLNADNFVDIAVVIEDPSGVFMTNSPPHSNINIVDVNGRVIPNWDLLTSNTLSGATSSFGYDQVFTEFIGQNGATSVTAVYHNAFSVLAINTNTAFYLTVSSEDEDNDRGVYPDPQGDGDPIPFDRAITTNQLVLFAVVDDDPDPPVFSTFNVDGAQYVNTDLGAGLEVTGLVQDLYSGIYGGASNRWELYWFDLLVDSGEFSTRPESDGAALQVAEPLGVTLTALSVTTTGLYTFVAIATDYDREHPDDALTASTGFNFAVVRPPLPEGAKGSYFVIDNDWASTVPLNYVENFDAFPLGALAGQQGWSGSSTGAEVSSTGYSGRGVALRGGYGTRGVAGAGATNVWIDWAARPVTRATDPVALADVGLKASAALYLNADGHVVALSNTTWLVYNHVTLPTNVWLRFSARMDYLNHRWSLYAAGPTPNALATNVFRNVPFHATLADTVVSFRMVEDGPAGNAGLDNLAIGAHMPMSIDEDANGMADAWELMYLNAIGVDPDADTDGDGISNRREFMAGTHPNDPASHMRLVSVDLAGELDTGVTLTWLGGEWPGPTNYIGAGDAVRRWYGMRAANVSPNNPMAQRATVWGGLSGTNTWLDPNAISLYSARYYHLTVGLGDGSYTNVEEWAMYAQPRTAGHTYLVSAPVDVGMPAWNNLNDRLGRQLSRGLRPAPENQYEQGDRLEYMLPDKSLKPLYLVSNDSGDVYWYDDDANAPADLAVTPGMGFWIVRGSQPATRGNMIFGGRSYLNSTVSAVPITLENGGWNLIGWPLARPRGQVNLGTSTPPSPLGFEAQATGGQADAVNTPAYLRGNKIWVWGNNEWDTRYWLMDHINATRDLRWWSNRDNSYATFDLQPGKAYYFLHLTNQWGGANFNWTPQSP